MVIHEMAEEVKYMEQQHEVVDKDGKTLYLNRIAQRYYGIKYAQDAAETADKLYPERAPFTTKLVTE